MYTKLHIVKGHSLKSVTCVHLHHLTLTQDQEEVLVLSSYPPPVWGVSSVFALHDVDFFLIFTSEVTLDLQKSCKCQL